MRIAALTLVKLLGIWRSFELQSSSLAKEMCRTNIVQVVLIDTEANILSWKYSDNPKTQLHSQVVGGI
jgi:hypothetical protein